jgi:hydroxyacylglutathione hydrolase
MISSGPFVRKLVVGSLSTNCYLLIDSKSKKTIIIDPGDDADYIENIISENKWKPVLLIATHGHFDHLLAATELKLAYNIPFFIHQKDEFLLNQLQESARHFLGINTDPPPKIDGNLKAGDTINIGSLKADIIHTPGHTPGSICLRLIKEKMLFCGDLIFAHGGIGRTDFSYSDHPLMVSSLKNILSLKPENLIYPGHGETTDIKSEKTLLNI